MPIFTRDKLAKFAPRPREAAKAQIWDGYADALCEHGDALCAEFGIDEALELQHFMARVGHECDGFMLIWENMHYRAERIMEVFGEGRHSAGVSSSEARYLAGNDQALAERVYGLGNPRKARELGNREPGDGYRYRGFGPMQTTGRADHEKYLGGDTSYRAALRAAFAEWDKKDCNEPARRDDAKTICKRINGGYNGLDDQRVRLTRAKRVWPVMPTDPVQPPETMLASTTGNTAIALGTGGTVSTATEVSTAMAKVAAGGSFSLSSFLMALASSPTFWVGVFTVAGAAYVWLERRRKLVNHGI